VTLLHPIYKVTVKIFPPPQHITTYLVKYSCAKNSDDLKHLLWLMINYKVV